MTYPFTLKPSPEDEKKSVMIVDDNANMFDYMCRLMATYEDYDVRYKALSLEMARNVLTEESPDLVFMDLQLPDGNGIDLVPFIKQFHPDTYVVIFTAYYGDFRNAAYTHGEDDYLLKPVDPEELDKVLRRYKKMNEEDNATVLDLGRNKLNGMVALVNASNELCPRRCEDIPFFRYDGKRKMWHAVLEGNLNFTLRKGTSAKDILLLNDKYQQSHQSFIVNLSYVDVIGNTFVRLSKPFDMYAIPMSRTYQHAFLERFRLV